MGALEGQQLVAVERSNVGCGDKKDASQMGDEESCTEVQVLFLSFEEGIT